MKHRVSDERGAVLATAIIVLMIMLGLGLALVSMTDTQTHASGKERLREARLNLTESALSNEIFDLSRNWPGTSGGAYPTCTPTATDSSVCPLASALRAQFNGADYSNATSWTIQVRDATDTDKFYDDKTTLANPAWDADGNGELWVRAQGWVGDPTKAQNSRVLIARVRVESVPIKFPNAPFLAGGMSTTNSGRHGGRYLIDGKGQPGIVRCADTTNPSCADFASFQVSDGVSSDTSLDTNVLPPEAVDSLRDTAKANGTYYANTCPADPTGAVVFVENANCAYNNATVKTDVNGANHNAIFVINSGTLSCNGNINWYGIIYLVNAQGSNGNVFDNTGGGGCTVNGGIFIDGDGKLAMGSNAPNLVYDAGVVLNAKAYGTAGIVQNTWRELTIPR